MAEPPESIPQLRQRMRAARADLGVANRRDHARGILRAGLRLRWLRQSRTVAFYLPVGGEADPLPLAARLYGAGANLYLPRIRGDHDMEFAPVGPGSPLRDNHFGISEPIGREWKSAGQLDCILLPLTAFDSRGNRLGMGGGYYDRALAGATRSPLRRPYLVGVAHAFQEVEHLSTHPWDVPLHAVITESTLYRFQGNP